LQICSANGTQESAALTKKRDNFEQRHTDKKVKREWESHLPLELYRYLKFLKEEHRKGLKKTRCHPFLGQDLHMHVNYE
jgi:hypothetical protein